MDKWKQFSQDFEKQDTDLAQQVLNATEAVKQAQEGPEASKKEAKDIEESEQDGRSDMAVEISDDENQELIDNKGQVLKEGVSFMLQNLESLRSKAEIAVEENACKRPRLQSTDGFGDASKSGPSEHFAQPSQ